MMKNNKSAFVNDYMRGKPQLQEDGRDWPPAKIIWETVFGFVAVLVVLGVAL